MRDLLREPWCKLTDGPKDVSIAAHMDAGNKLRKDLGRHDAVAMLGVAAMGEERRQHSGSPREPIAGFAHILNSLKRPEEITSLRRIYGPSLIVLAAHTPRSKRVQNLAGEIALTHHSNRAGTFVEVAEKLVGRDQSETGESFGQNVEETFSIADIVVNTTSQDSLDSSIKRAVELLFGNAFLTPEPDEQGMYLARTAALRSSSLARQVGAAICRQDGSVVSLGVNEVPKPGGGAYWCSDEEDSRDFRRGFDSSDRMRRNVLAEILQRLMDSGWLNPEKSARPVEDLVAEALDPARPGMMRNAQFMGTIDYVRAVHAEMAAITNAARWGSSTSECTLYVTTFPCHDCAKHIVASGIERVVYIEPYPKSLVPELYPDSIDVDPVGQSGRVRFEPFVGVAPERYVDLFERSGAERKSRDGTMLRWNASEASPRLSEHMHSEASILAAEREALREFFSQLESLGLAEPKE